MVETIERMLTMIPPEAAATDAGKMEVLRDYLYRAGWWNEKRPYAYDMDDLAGQRCRAQLLPTYLALAEGQLRLDANFGADPGRAARARA